MKDTKITNSKDIDELLLKLKRLNEELISSDLSVESNLVKNNKRRDLINEIYSIKLRLINLKNIPTNYKGD